VRLTLAQASLLRHRARTLLAVLGVAVAAAMLLDMVMLATGMRESFRQLLVSRGFDLRLAPKGTLPFDTDATIPGVAAITAVLRNNPDVRIAPSTIRGKVTGSEFSARVRFLKPDEFPYAKQLIKAKYWLARVPFLWRNTDTYLEITPGPA